ncbi:MAG: ABC transporter substrate-binding protein [Polyangiaceae bacterium]
MRVVALTCSNTEIVCALGCADMLVAVDAHSDYPASVVCSLPRVGPDLGIDAALVAAQRPDLVLASLSVPGHERVVEDLQRRKLPFVALEPISLEDVYANIRQVASLLGVAERGEALVRQMQRELSPSAAVDGPRILVEWWPKPLIAPGRDSWVNQVLAAAGAVNPLAERACKSTPLTDEDAAALAPDASVISWCGVRLEKYRPDVVLRRPAWQRLTLVAERRVYPISEAWLGRPGPRLVEGARALRGVVKQLGSPS